jgi:hypothetical protein
MAYTIDGRVGLLGVKEGGFMAGKLKHGPGISRFEAARHKVAGSGGIWRWNGRAW